MGISSKGEVAALTAILTGCYVSLHTATPGNTGADEVTGTGYAREAGGAFTVTEGDGASTLTTGTNDAIVEFDAAGGSWGTVTHFGIWSAVSGGNFLGGNSLSASKTIAINDIARFAAGSLDFDADGTP